MTHFDAGDKATLPQFNPFSAEYRANPYPILDLYRTQDSIHWGVPALPDLPGSWYFFRFKDVMQVFKDARFSSDMSQVLPADQIPARLKAFGDPNSAPMIFRDPPAHTRLRSLVNKAFTPQIMEAFRPRIEAVATELLEQAIAENQSGRLDLVSSFAFPLPVVVISEMLGVPSQDRTRFKEWSSAIIAAVDMLQKPEIYQRAGIALRELHGYLAGVLAERRQNPQDDLMTALAQAEEQGGKLTEREIFSTCSLLLSAGHETTANLIGNSVLALSAHPEQWQMLKDDPTLIPNAVEEFLRYDSPAQTSSRWVTQDMEWDGRQLKKGDNVYVMLGAANRDPAQFENPNELDIRRPLSRHSAFGLGIHFCLGAPLARLEGQIALTTLMRHLPNLALQTDSLEWHDTVVVRGLKSLPVVL